MICYSLQPVNDAMLTKSSSVSSDSLSEIPLADVQMSSPSPQAPAKVRNITKPVYPSLLQSVLILCFSCLNPRKICYVLEFFLASLF
jgi:hypothetical protein